MSHVDAAARGTVANRSSVSRKLLSRKAAERAVEGVLQGDALEDSFPRDGGEAPLNDGSIGKAAQAISGTDDVAPPTSSAEIAASRLAAGPESLTVAHATTPGTAQPTATPQWSEADESAFQALAARRKAAGYQRRGRDVGGQLLRVGDVAPNPATVAAVIVGLVAERGTVVRGELVAAMAEAGFPHPKAKPSDRGWCQGYVAGCVRDGFLAAAATHPVAASGADAIGAVR